MAVSYWASCAPLLTIEMLRHENRSRESDSEQYANEEALRTSNYICQLKRVWALSFVYCT